MANPNMVKGGPSVNPSGMTKEQKEARDALTLWLAGDMREVGKKAYQKALEDGNPAIIKDWADRLLGKPKERLELSEDPDAPRIDGWTLGDVLAALKAAREAKK